MSLPSVRPDAGTLTRRSPPSRRSSDDDPLSGDDFSWNRSTRMLDIGHRRTSVDYLPEKKPLLEGVEGLGSGDKCSDGARGRYAL